VGKKKSRSIELCPNGRGTGGKQTRPRGTAGVSGGKKRVNETRLVQPEKDSPLKKETRERESAKKERRSVGPENRKRKKSCEKGSEGITSK